MKTRKTSAGILRNETEGRHMDQLARTQDSLTPKAVKALKESKTARGGWSKVRDN